MQAHSSSFRVTSFLLTENLLGASVYSRKKCDSRNKARFGRELDRVNTRTLFRCVFLERDATTIAQEI